jgi:hypothetical protein
MRPTSLSQLFDLADEHLGLDASRVDAAAQARWGNRPGFTTASLNGNSLTILWNFLITEHARVSA